MTKKTKKEFDILFCFGDRHYPDNDPIIDELLLELMKDLSPDIIVDGGDMINADSLSNYPKKWSQLSGLGEEIQADRDWRQRIQKVSPNSQKFVLYDNHFCRRLDDKLKNPEFYALDDLNILTVENLFNFKNIKWSLVKKYNWKDNIIFVHGDSPGLKGNRNCPVNNARSVSQRIGCTIVKWHSHATGIETYTGINGQLRHAIQLGHIMDTSKTTYIKHPDIGGTSQSVCVFYLSKKTDKFHYVPIVISDRSFVFNGKVYK